MARVIFCLVLMLCVVASPLVWGDRGAPDLPLVFDPQTKKHFIGGEAKFVLKPGNASGVIEKIEISIDGGSFAPYEDYIRFQEEGKHSIRFRAKNPIDTWSPVQVTEVFVDRSAPHSEAKVSESTSYREGSTTHASLGTVISLTATDALSGVGRIEYSWDNSSFSPYTHPISLSKPGKQTFYYRSIDKVGNVEGTRELEVNADSSPPGTVLEVKGPVKQIPIEGRQLLAASDGTAFGLTVSDDSSGVKATWVMIDGAAAVPYTSPIYFLKGGQHTLKYSSEDRVGNKEPWKEVALFTVSAAPTTTAVPEGKVVSNSGVNFATGNLAVRLVPGEGPVGVERLEYRFNEENEYRPYLEPIRFPGEGSYHLSYRAVDRVGNVEPTRVFSVTIHERAPQTAVSTAQPITEKEGVLYSPAPNLVTLQPGASLVGVDKILVSVNGGPFGVYQGPIRLGAERQTYQLTFQSVDKLGRQEVPRTLTYRMVSTAPVVDLFVSADSRGEQKMRTDFFDESRETASPPAAVKARVPASPAKPGKKSRKRK